MGTRRCRRLKPPMAVWAAWRLRRVSSCPEAQAGYWLVMLAAVAVISKVLVSVVIVPAHMSVTVVAAAPIVTGERAINVAESLPEASKPIWNLTNGVSPAGLVKWQLPLSPSVVLEVDSCPLASTRYTPADPAGIVIAATAW